MLAVQLQRLISDDKRMPKSDNRKSSKVTKNAISLDNQSKDLEDIRCSLCKRNCRRRAVFCEAQKHLVHYPCAKLK